MMNRLPKLEWNWEEFCGTKNFTIWTDSHHDLSQCFQTVCLQIPILFFIAIISAYYAGKYDEEWTVRTSREKKVIKLRMAVVLTMALLPASRIIVQVIHNPKSLHAVNYFFTILESFTWFVHFSYVAALKNRLGASLRGPVTLASLYATFYVICVIRAKSLYVEYVINGLPDAWLYFIYAIITLFAQTLYGVTLIPSEDSPSRRTTIDAVDRDDIMHTTLLSQYSRFREDFDPHYIGTAMEGSGFTSRLFFQWPNRLIEKGEKARINGPDDVFDLPEDLACSTLHNKLKNALDAQAVNENASRISLVKGLHKCFAKEFYGIGILKFIADLASFASPLLLHQLMVFIDDEQIPVAHGYFYGTGIFLASFIGSFCSVHFDFFIGKISLKLQGSLIAHIYRKILLLNPSVFREIRVGEIVNHISTDMSRIANSCISFHAVWSIPFQLFVTMYLLYTQVGIAFVAGVIFSVILIPINKVIALKIGELSGLMMEEKDKRVELMSELIKGIRVVKLHVWEEYFITKILGIRIKEMKYLKYRKYLDALCVYFWATTPVFISIMTFTIHVCLGGELSAAIVFTSLALLNMLIVPLNAFPWVLNGVIEAWVSLRRVNSYLQFDEINISTYYTSKSDHSKSVIIKGGSFSWDFDRMHLSNINLSIQKGHLVGIIGPVGSGKSSLLAAILGEIQGVKGFVSVDDISDGVGYVSQTPWIQQCSVRENILFGKNYESRKYREVVESCALMEDFNSWRNGDLEIVGEGGSTLSGGQKARIALARAVYQDKSIYVMDDVLSAVDTQVAVHIFNECVKKLLSKKTRILVTHFTKLLNSADWVVVLDDGQIVNQGPSAQILSGIDLSVGSSQLMEPIQSENISGNAIRNEIDEEEYEKERREKGVVSFGVYSAYWKAVGHGLALFILLSVVAMQISRHAVDWWLSVWVITNTDLLSNKTDFSYLTPFESNILRGHDFDVMYFLIVYIALGVGNSVIVIIRAFVFAYGGIRAAKRIHKSLLTTIVQAHVEFFDSSSLGRVLNRFSSDINTVDDTLPFIVNILLAQFFAVIGSVFMTIYGIPWLCLVLAPLVPIYHGLQHCYRLTSRELKRLSSVTLSPLYSHVSETISGLMTIRAFKESPRFMRDNEDKVDTMQKCSFSSLAATVWLNIRLQIIGVLIIGGVCLIAVLQRHFDVAHSGFVGLAISYALSLTGNLGGVINVFTDTEQKMVAMERIDEYIKKTKSESRDCKNQIALPFAWPCQGVVSFINVNLKYREDGEYSLKDINFETHPGEKIGIVGRTGAGKSSLFVTLFRLAEVTSGVICIDAINISNVSLKKLRSKITIIPQDPFIFAGTIRENVDPLNEHEEFQIWDAFNKCDLIPLVKKLGGLNAHLRTGGTNVSVGERQLLCLVRAILRNTKVVCIDEATANLDSETDKQIQKAIHSSFKSSTVFIIAHRIQSVMECDRVLVMGHGEVLEFDTPETLLQNQSSNFYKFVNQRFTA